MSQELKVGISAYQVASAPDVLMTLGLGSCIGIAIYDPRSKIGGLSHIMLPDSHLFKDRPELKKEKFADLAIPLMVAEIQTQTKSKKLVAKIAGGASMFQFNENANMGQIGARNILAVEMILEQLEIPLLASHTGGNKGRTMIVDLTNFEMKIKMANREIIEL